ncbi:sensor histidine kinase [Desmospora activa]|uniref:histidine kinase n=1 Tax=Desmospora activa DSM 45169 TaxID=1121389 RepID=A0A2T4Z7S2_9BACL|nr:sensor histidine kinase [Desmospora activa]PTM57931.1 two-component system sensor histidine kinase DesK [Desmospora activa DSM 45169]
MLQKLYPRDQIDKYLFVDVIAFVSLAYQVFLVYHSFGFIGSFLLYGIYFGAYYVGLWYQDWRIVISIYTGCGVLAVLGLFYHPFLTFYAFIQAAQLGLVRSKRLIGVSMLAILVMHATVYYGREGEWTGFGESYYLLLLILQLLTPMILYIIQRSRSLGDALDEANKKIERYAQEEERNRIARDLHDTLGQTLTMIKMKSELAMRLMDKESKQAKQEMKEVMETSRFALKQVREVVTSMKHVSVAEEIKQGQILFQTAKVDVIIKESGPQPNLSQVKETMLALSMREAFTNVMKHSQAQTCTVQLGWKSDGQYVVKVVDDGVGLTNKEKLGHGIESMRERMHLVGGSAVVGASVDGGFVVTLSIPANHGKDEKGP